MVTLWLRVVHAHPVAKGCPGPGPGSRARGRMSPLRYVWCNCYLVAEQSSAIVRPGNIHAHYHAVYEVRAAARRTPESIMCGDFNKILLTLVDDATHLTPKMLPPEGVAQSKE